MHIRTTGALAGSLAGIAYLTLGSAGCGTSTAATTDTAYEDSYSTAYAYPADVAYSGVYAGGGFGYGIYLATPGGVVAAKSDGGASRTDGGSTILGGNGVRQAVVTRSGPWPTAARSVPAR